MFLLGDLLSFAVFRRIWRLFRRKASDSPSGRLYAGDTDGFSYTKTDFYRYDNERLYTSVEERLDEDLADDFMMDDW